MIEKDDGMIIVLSGSDRIKEYDLALINKNRISFGREETNDIVIPSPIVSRVHGYIEKTDGKIYISDNNSTNGIYINDIYCGIGYKSSTAPHQIKDGDIILIDYNDDIKTSDKRVIIVYTKNRKAGMWKAYPLEKISSISIGRSKSNNIQIKNVKISRWHAVIRREGGRYFINDNKSFNGTFVNGERITHEQELQDRAVIYLASNVLLFVKGFLFYKTEPGGNSVLMQGINRTVNDRKSKTGKKRILNNINIQIEPNDFVAIIGGSGSGKTTIMNAMSGYEKATSGKVYINSVDLYKHYKVLKNNIGYVPQQDIIYENLTLIKMLEYSAKLRMADDMSNEEIRKRIDDVLEMVELKPHKHKMIRSLSGGQKKRASIAVELLGDPGLFFLDEPTSGLDPGTEENLMKNLRNLAKSNNKTVIMVTHTTQNLHLCDKIILMGTDGNICFYGTVPECIETFGVKNLTEVYNMVSDPKDVKKWSDEYYKKEGIKIGFKKTSEGKVPKAKREKFVKQLLILAKRYINLIVNDKTRLRMIFAQPILIGILLAFVASDTVFEIYNGTKSIMFALSCAGIWVGLFNSIQEVCKERVILKREYMANLRLDAYIASKLIVQLLLSAIQAALLVLVFIITIGKPKGVLYGNSAFELFITMMLTIISSASVGLIVSSVSKNSDKAMTAAPFLLIIQLLFSGILFELSNITELISYMTVSKWSVAALGISSDLNSLPSLGEIKRNYEDIFTFTAENLYNTWIILAVFVVISVIISILLLRNISKDSR